MRNLEEIQEDKRIAERNLYNINGEQSTAERFIEYIKEMIIDDSDKLKDSYESSCIGKFYTCGIYGFKPEVTRPDLFPGIRRTFFETSLKFFLIEKESCKGCDHCNWINDYFESHWMVDEPIHNLMGSDKLTIGEKYRFQWRYDHENLKKRTVPKLFIVK